MNRKTKRTIVWVSVITLTLILALQSSVLARATDVEVKGVWTGAWKNKTGRGWPDNGGNWHFVAQPFGSTWTDPYVPFQLDSASDGTPIVTGNLDMVLNCKLAPPGSGPCKGPATITDAAGTLLWEGQGHLRVVAMVSTGQITLQGRGPYEGTHLVLDVQELGTGNTDVFDVTGRLLFPHGE